MAAMFAVNRSTVREGIRRLECEDFVRRAVQNGDEHPAHGGTDIAPDPRADP